MDFSKIITHTRYVFIALMLSFTLIGSDSMAEQKVLISPLKLPSKSFNRIESNQQNSSNDYSQHGYIYFNSELVTPVLNIKANDVINLTFFDDASYEVVVETITYNQNNTISISGKIKDHLFSTVTMTLDKDNFILILKDLKKNHEYTAYGAIKEGLGVIKEVNINKAPERKHLPPLEVR